MTAEIKFSTDWILLAVDHNNEAFVLDADEGFWRYDLLTEHWACDNGIDFPAGLQPGLYRLNAVIITPDSIGDPTFKGTLQALHVHERAPSEQRECALSPLSSGHHQVDTSMETGPNNCFFCEKPMPRLAPAQ